MPGIPETLQQTADRLRDMGTRPEQAYQLLVGVTEAPSTHDTILALKTTVDATDDSVERVLLWHAAQQSLAQVDVLPVAPGVKRLLTKQLRVLPDPNIKYAAGSYMFTRAARITTFRRFPAGVMDWDLSGIPRSWLLKVPARDLPRLLSVVALELRGVRPCFFMHVAPKPQSRALVVEMEVMRAFYRMAKSLELQPAMKAILAAAWFYDPMALKDNPHLEYLHKPIRDHEGFLTTIGTAPADAGFLEGNAERRRRYEAGELHYQIGLAIWPRRAALSWAAAHVELEE